MSDLPVIALITAKPGSEDLVRSSLQELAAESRKEPGCVSYELHESAAAPGTFVTVEAWKSQADLDGHMQTPHIAAALGKVGDALAAPPAIHPLQPVDLG